MEDNFKKNKKQNTLSSVITYYYEARVSPRGYTAHLSSTFLVFWELVTGCKDTSSRRVTPEALPITVSPQQPLPELQRVRSSCAFSFLRETTDAKRTKGVGCGSTPEAREHVCWCLPDMA